MNNLDGSHTGPVTGSSFDSGGDNRSDIDLLTQILDKIKIIEDIKDNTTNIYNDINIIRTNTTNIKETIGESLNQTFENFKDIIVDKIDTIPTNSGGSSFGGSSFGSGTWESSNNYINYDSGSSNISSDDLIGGIMNTFQNSMQQLEFGYQQFAINYAQIKNENKMLLTYSMKYKHLHKDVLCKLQQFMCYFEDGEYNTLNDY